MPQSHLAHALIMFAAGVGIPVFANLNAALGARIGSPAAAAVCLFAVAAAGSLAVCLMTGPAALTKLPAQPRALLLAGLLTAFYALSITWVAPSFGLGNAVFFVLLGQLVSAAAIDHFGLAGARVAPLSPMRAGGIAVMALGVFMTQKA